MERVSTPLFRTWFLFDFIYISSLKGIVNDTNANSIELYHSLKHKLERWTVFLLYYSH